MNYVKGVFMLLIPNAILTEYAAHLNTKKIPATRISEYKKWLRYYLGFCDKYPLPPEKAEQVRLFCEKLKEKKQSDEQRERAAHAVSLYFDDSITSNCANLTLVLESYIEALHRIQSDVRCCYQLFLKIFSGQNPYLPDSPLTLFTNHLISLKKHLEFND